MQAGDAIEDISFEQSLARCFDFCEVHNVWETPGACDDTALNKFYRGETVIMSTNRAQYAVQDAKAYHQKHALDRLLNMNH